MLRHGALSTRRLMTNRLWQRHIQSLPNALAMGAPIDVHPEVQQALAKNEPVVALETTIVTHGMPQPTNLETARAVEGIVRAQGAIPATIGIIQGRVKIGLRDHELEHLADVHNTSVVKVSRRDLGPVLALKRNGGTTCSTTLIFAAMAGIKVFATGGLGGVHRGGEHTMDVSADLPELSRCPVGLVSAGVKSILDIGRTLEYLETLGVPVVSYGTDDFPAFYSRKSGFKSPWRVDDPQSAARLLHAQAQLGLTNGAIFAAPIPEEYEAVGAELQVAVEQALQEAEENGVNRLGKEATPWLLKRVGELTAGRSLASNVALIKNTARIGGQIAVCYANLVKDAGGPLHTIQSSFDLSVSTPPAPTTPEFMRPPTPIDKKAESDTAELVVVGCTALDITSQANDNVNVALSSQSTTPGVVQTSLGGVGRNVAEAAHRLLPLSSRTQPSTVVLVSPIGKDIFGRMLTEEIARIGMRSDGLRQIDNERSAVCNMVVNGTGDLVSGVADMNIIQAFTGEQAVDAIKHYKPTVVAIDGNLSPKAIQTIVEHCSANQIEVFFEPTSVTKSERILPAISSVFSKSNSPPISYVSPNLLELSQLYQIASCDPYELTSHSKWWNTIDSMSLSSEFRMDLQHLARRPASDDESAGTLDFITEDGVAQMAIHLLPFFQHIILKCGNRGVLTIFRAKTVTGVSESWAQETTNLKQRQVVARGKDGSAIVIKHYPAVNLAQDEVVNVTGAGDTLVGSLLASLVQNPRIFESPRALDEGISRAQKAAVMTLRSAYAVSPLLPNLQ